jgi:hypothetical protein
VLEAKGTTVMTATPTDDQPGFVAEEPEHCHGCYRLIQPGETYYLTVGQAILCEACLESADAIRVSDDLAVVAEEERILVRRESAAVAVHPREVRRLLDALVEAGMTLEEQEQRIATPGDREWITSIR